MIVLVGGYSMEGEMSSCRLIIGADLVATESNVKLFIQREVDTLFGKKLVKKLSEADYRIFNLEAPLTDQECPIRKCGPHLIMPTEAVNGYKALGADILTLANNHILDQGEQGLKSTCQVLSNNNIVYLGVGDTFKEAAKPYVFENDGKKIGIYACAEHEFSIISSAVAGANPFEPLETPDHVEKLKSECDFVAILYHGGKEHYRYPSPKLQKTCRKLVEKGADLVICQHTHCIGCEEKYQSGLIVYGQGNFLFDHSKNECWQTGLLVQVNRDFTISYLPLVKWGNRVRLAEGKVAEDILYGFNHRSEEIKQAGLVEEKYTKYAETMLENYFVKLSGRQNFGVRVLNRLSGGLLRKSLNRRHYEENALLAIRNCIECEAHRELLLSGLEGRIK